MPSLRSIQRRHRVASTTAIRALDQLSKEGRVVSRKRSGYFVADREQQDQVTRLVERMERLEEQVRELRARLDERDERATDDGGR